MVTLDWKIYGADVPVLQQLVCYPTLQASTRQQPNGNVGIKVANARRTDARISSVSRRGRDINTVDRKPLTAQRPTSSGLVLSRIQPFHLFAMRSPTPPPGEPNASMIS